MKVFTKYYAFIRERLGRSDEEFELEEDSTVADFLKLLSEKCLSWKRTRRSPTF